jgi:DNA-binding transcriptional LysR family regulator
MRPNVRSFVSATGERCEIRYRPIVEVDSVEAAFHLSRLGTGLSAPPIDMSAAAVARGDLVTLVPDWSLEPLKVSAIWPANVPAASSVHRLVNAMCEATRNPPVSA